MAAVKKIGYSLFVIGMAFYLCGCCSGIKKDIKLLKEDLKQLREKDLKTTVESLNKKLALLSQARPPAPPTFDSGWVPFNAENNPHVFPILKQKFFYVVYGKDRSGEIHQRWSFGYPQIPNSAWEVTHEIKNQGKSVEVVKRYIGRAPSWRDTEVWAFLRIYIWEWD